MLGSVAILAGLSVADRFTAWLIGEFPSSAALWQLRFEYLRPIAVYHDLAELSFGSWSPWSFSTVVITAGAVIASGALSRVRLARAISYHLLFGAAGALVVLCFDSDLSIRSRAVIGTPSEPYFLLGSLLATIAATLCLRVHAEYIGWRPSSLRIVRNLRMSVAGVRSSIASVVIEVIEQLGLTPSQSGAAVALIPADRQRQSRKQQSHV